MTKEHLIAVLQYTICFLIRPKPFLETRMCRPHGQNSRSLEAKMRIPWQLLLIEIWSQNIWESKAKLMKQLDRIPVIQSQSVTTTALPRNAKSIHAGLGFKKETRSITHFSNLHHNSRSASGITSQQTLDRFNPRSHHTSNFKNKKFQDNSAN